MDTLRSVRVRNFKAVRDSGSVKLGALTVFIGNNGAGKSSLIEALQLFQSVVLDGVDTAFAPFGGIAHVRHKEARTFKSRAAGDAGAQTAPVEVKLRALGLATGPAQVTMQLNTSPTLGAYVQGEEVITRAGRMKRDFDRHAADIGADRSMISPLGDTRAVYQAVERWQFVALMPDLMGGARPQQRQRGKVRLGRDGSNLAGYMLDLATRAPDALNGVVDAMRFVLPYASDVRPVMPDARIDQRVYLELKERDFDVPGWLFSSGTLRMLAILCLLRDPEPPPVIFIEELENGLDPRTIGLLVEEMRRVVKAKRTQIVATTHSPYLLDQLLFEHIVVVERDAEGHPAFWRPENERALDDWAEDFSPGQIYTMGQLHREPKKKGAV